MADDWEDWEDETYTPPPVAPPSANGKKFETVGQAVLAKATEPDASKFAGEDEEEDEAPAWEAHVPKPQVPKEKKKAYEELQREREGGTVYEDDTPLDDPVAEKLRRQRLVEEADFKSTKDLFGGSTSGKDEAGLDGFIPKTAKDFEEYARLLNAKYLQPHIKATQYKLLLKALLKQALAGVGVQEVKDLESCLAGVRSDKLKEEKAAKNVAKGGPKKVLNVGKAGASAGLDDYKFDEALDDDVDFM